MDETTVESRHTDVYISLQLHLYDVDVPGKIKFQESEFLSPGNELFMFETGKFFFSSDRPH